MLGSIYTSEHCPICGGSLVHDENRGGCFCARHPDQAARGHFRVYFGRKVARRFASYLQAIRFLTGLRFKRDENTFDARDYQAANPLSFENQAEKWLAGKKREIKHNTYRDLRLTMKKATAAWGQRNVKSIGFGDIEDFLNGLGVAAKTRANARSCLHQFFAWLFRREGIPIPDMPEVSFELGWRNIVDLQTQSAILEEIRRQTWEINPRIWIGARWLATYVAIRPGELRNLRERDIDCNGFFVIPSPKEKKPKLVPMLEDDRELYRQVNTGVAVMPDMFFFRHGKGNGTAAPGSRFSKDYIYRWWKRACAALGIAGVDLYGGTRHSSASALGAHFSAEELRDYGTMHATNKAFERYMQHKAAPSTKVYRKLQELKAKKAGAVDIKNYQKFIKTNVTD